LQSRVTPAAAIKWKKGNPATLLRPNSRKEPGALSINPAGTFLLAYGLCKPGALRITAELALPCLKHLCQTRLVAAQESVTHYNGIQRFHYVVARLRAIFLESQFLGISSTLECIRKLSLSLRCHIVFPIPQCGFEVGWPINERDFLKVALFDDRRIIVAALLSLCRNQAILCQKLASQRQIGKLSSNSYRAAISEIKAARLVQVEAASCLQ
jgi:hypothetical protein